MSFKEALADCWYRACPWVYLLAPLAGVFILISALRRAAYRLGLLRVIRLPVPVIVVGNISVGGTGKTPFVLWLVAALQAAGWHPGIISRGYRGRAGEASAVAVEADPLDCGDEPVLLARRAGCPVWVGRRRAAVGAALLAAHPEVNLLIADDGLQHYALARDIEIAVLDGARGLGNGWRLPVGPLREARARLAGVDALVVNGQAANPGLAAGAYPMHLVGREFFNVRHPDRRLGPEAFHGQPVHALAGIGNPERFFSTLEQLGIQARPLAFADHHRFSLEDLPEGTLLMTEKDAVKCAAFARENMWALRVDAQVADGLQTLIIDKLKKLHGQQTA